jgi:hypothetical protein
MPNIEDGMLKAKYGSSQYPVISTHLTIVLKNTGAGKSKRKQRCFISESAKSAE